MYATALVFTLMMKARPTVSVVASGSLTVYGSEPVRTWFCVEAAVRLTGEATCLVVLMLADVIALWTNAVVATLVLESVEGVTVGATTEPPESVSAWPLALAIV